MRKGRCVDYGVATGFRIDSNSMSVAASMDASDLHMLLRAFVEALPLKKRRAASLAAKAFLDHFYLKTRVQLEFAMAVRPGVDFRQCPIRLGTRR